jgi:hypothetical protein
MRKNIKTIPEENKKPVPEDIHSSPAGNALTTLRLRKSLARVVQNQNIALSLVLFGVTMHISTSNQQEFGT